MSPRFTETVLQKQESVITNDNNQQVADNTNIMDEDDDVSPLNSDEDDGNYDDDDDDDDDDDEIDINELLEDEDGAKKTLKRKSSSNNEEDEGGTKKKKKKATVSRAPPTVEEMTRLRETENLFHSNLFRLQIEELLREVRTKKRERRFARLWLDNVLKEICLVEDSAKRSSSKPKVKYPLPKLPDDPKESEFKFEKPTGVKIIGSFSSATCLGPKFSIDVLVYMSKSLFAQDDYLNARYHRKRALFLCRLAERLLQLKSLVDHPRFLLPASDPLRPLLVFSPRQEEEEGEGEEEGYKWRSKVTVRLHAVPEAGAFKPTRFTPEKNNVRAVWWTNRATKASSIEGELSPTPHYNYSIGRDVAADANESLQKLVFEENRNMRDALLLLRVWLRQRQLDMGDNSFNGFVLTMWLTYLFKSRKLNAHMSSYQVVRNTWLAFEQSDWLTAGPSLFQAANGVSTSATSSAPNGFHPYYDVVFIDSTGFVNIAADMSALTYTRVKEEASLALKYLDNPSLNSFQLLFMTNMPFLHQFDHILRITNSDSVIEHWTKNKMADKLLSPSKRLDRLKDSRALLEDAVTSLLQRGLGKRVDRMAVECGRASAVSWPVRQKRGESGEQIVIGLKLNAEHGLLVLEKGPEANLPEAIEFRQFWGGKSELRRFQDGSICEAIAWEAATASNRRRRLIVRTIVGHLLQQNLHLPANAYTYVADQIDKSVMLRDLSADCDLTTAQQRVVSVLDGLSRLLLDIDDLPLTLASVQGTSASLRCCDVIPPLPYPLHAQSSASFASTNQSIDAPLETAPFSVEPIDAVIQLGLSKKWPEDIAAIRRIKAAFYLELAKKLEDRHKLTVWTYPDYLIVWKDDFAFRLRVVYQQEIALMKVQLGEGGMTSYKDNAQSLAMERDLVHLPLITSVLYGLSRQCLGFSPAVSLTKRWMRAHLCDDVIFPDVAVELVVASMFVTSQPYAQSLQPQVAFLRVLRRLANTNWCMEPVIVNFNNEMSRDDISEIEELFRAGRELGSLPALFIATNHDKSGSVFTRNAPILPVLFHVAKIARASLDVLENQLMSNDAMTVDYKVVFRPPLEFFDWLINLNAAMNSSSSQSIDADIRKRLKKKTNNSNNLGLPLIGFNPVACFLQELRRHYNDFALFFHDTYGGNTIGVLFRPAARIKRDFKVSHLNARKPIFEDGDPKLVLNEEAILEDFRILGKGVVSNIVINKNIA